MVDKQHRENIEKFFAIARERYNIFLKRRAGLPRPWSGDPIFNKHRFCNVLREDDRTTAWFRDNMRWCVENDPVAALLTIVAFRWFNKIEIGEVLMDPSVGLYDGNFMTETAEALIQGRFPNGPFVTGAFIVKTPDGMNKLNGVLWCINKFQNKLQAGNFKKLLAGYATHQEAQALLQEAPFLGRFMAYQIIADARYTCLLNNAPDINTWAQPGPGSTRGIGRIFYNDVDKFKYGSTKDEKEVIARMVELLSYSCLEEFWPKEWPQWEMQVVQNWCCEYDKYERCEEGGRMKRKYP